MENLYLFLFSHQWNSRSIGESFLIFFICIFDQNSLNTSTAISFFHQELMKNFGNSLRILETSWSEFLSENLCLTLFFTFSAGKIWLNLTLARITLWPETFGTWHYGLSDTSAQHNWAHYILDLPHYGSRLFGLWLFGSWHLGPNDTSAYHDLA